MDRETEFVRALSEFLAANTELSASYLGGLIESFMRSTRGLPDIDPSLKQEILRRVHADMGDPDGVPTFLHKFFLTYFNRNLWPPNAGFIAARYLRRGSGERFAAWPKRQEFVSELNDEVMPGTELGYRQALYSQGAGNVFRWRGVRCFKTAQDIAVYAMLIDELQPGTIIELGSGDGGSALLFANLCTSMGLATQIISVDTSLVKSRAPVSNSSDRIARNGLVLPRRDANYAAPYC